MKFYVKTKLSENISETPEGFLLCRNVMLTHTGALKYGPTEHPFGEEIGEVIMKREPKDLFSPATMGSFEGKDITIQHPDDFVDPSNYQELTNGVLMNIRKGSEKIEVEGDEAETLLGDLLIKSKEAIELVKAGMREVSLGYDALWELISDNEGRHSKIVGNHCALVDEGRAGKYCAITDHKKENEFMTKEAIEKFKKLFGKSVDEAMKEKEDEESKKAKDAEEAEKKKKEEEEKAAKDAEEAAKKEKESKDSELEAKVEKLTTIVEKLLEKLAGEESESEDEDEEEVIVADEESEDEDEEESESEDEGEEEDKEKKDKKAGDATNVLSRAEILAPGIKKTPDIKIKALEASYKTEDGKKIINTLTGGKEPSKLDKKAVDAIFIAASEMMKAKRVKDVAAQRVTTIDSFPALKGTGSKSAEDINKKNAEFYNSKK